MSHTLRGAGSAAATACTKRALKMRPYITAMATAVGLMAAWAALVQFAA
jgi:hypothetical protein